MDRLTKTIVSAYNLDVQFGDFLKSAQIDPTSISSRLSFGQRKLLQVAVAIFSGASVLILDEPLAGLDPNATEKVREMIIRAKNVHAQAIIIVEHPSNAS